MKRSGFRTWSGVGGSEGTSAQFAYSFSPDGRYLAYLSHVVDTGYDLWLLEVATGRRIPFLRSPHDESHPMISPDGRWVAYVSDETGRREVFVTTFPRAGGRWRISTDGGDEPRWSRDGGELFYRAGEDMMAVEIAGGDPRRAAAPAVLFSGDYAPGGTNPGFPRYDVSPDGQRFLMIEETGAGGPPPELRIVLDWFDELRQKVSGAGGR